MRRAFYALIAFLAALAVVLYVLARPATIPASALPAHTPDIDNGKYMFIAGGCAECHAVPVKDCEDLNIEAKEVLAGGRCLKTAFGTFHVPNISPDKETGSAIGPRSTSSTP